mmetsp:Transcript_28102/g.57739  ORF Transcript_28102/g.57739 Transcript_28102/m.57739 type:complete len:177 (+) Transcript_28102:83-613(+)
MVFDPELVSPVAAAAAMEAELLDGRSDPNADCFPERPRPVRNGQRNRFNLESLSAFCADANGVTYEWGSQNRINNADECAEFCVNGVPNDSLYDALRGFEYNCGSTACRCLYDQGSINSANSRSFRDSNYNNRSTKGRGSIKRLSGKRTTSFACYKRVGSELLEEDDVTSSLRGRN